MTFFHLKTLLVVSLKLNFAWAGGWSGNGGLTVKDSANPWFLGEEKIPYCISVSNESNLLLPAAYDLIIQKSSQKWGDFFVKYGINSPENWKYVQFPDRVSRHIQTKFEKSRNCDEVIRVCTSSQFDEGKCYDILQNQILFLIGQPNPIVRKFLEIQGSAVGYSLRTEYNHKSYRSGGIVWISRMTTAGWSEYSHILLHEIGHVLGMKHNSCWVMDENVSDRLHDWSMVDLEKIESTLWPYSLTEKALLTFTDPRYSSGNAPVGYYENKFYIKSQISNFEFSPDGAFQLLGEITALPMMSKIEMRLIFREYGTGKEQIFEGSLHSNDSTQSYTNYVPGLFTEWLYSGGSKAYRYEFFSTGWTSMSYQGVLQWKNKSIPVTLQRGRGLRVNFLFPEDQSWTTIGSGWW